MQAIYRELAIVLYTVLPMDSKSIPLIAKFDRSSLIDKAKDLEYLKLQGLKSLAQEERDQFSLIVSDGILPLNGPIRRILNPNQIQLINESKNIHRLNDDML